MASRIEDYALIGDTQTAALVGRDGSIDWLCVPRFDSGACFAALLGEPEHGRWLLAPRNADKASVRRRYREGTLVLETTFVTVDGSVRVIDFMSPRDGTLELARIVEGVQGEVPMHFELRVRFDYGSIVPWVTQLSGARLRAIAGADALVLDSGVATHGEGLTTVADFVVRPQQRIPFALTWYPSHEPTPPGSTPRPRWSRPKRGGGNGRDDCRYQGPWRGEVITLR